MLQSLQICKRMLMLSPDESQLLAQKINSFLIKEISHLTASELAQVEIEAKLGIFVDKKSGERVQPSSGDSCANFHILASGRGKWFAFQSGIGLARHKNANIFLNERFSQMKHAAATNALSSSSNDAWYKRTKSIDHIFHTRSAAAQKLRASYEMGADGRPLRLLEVIDKQRIADIAVHLPGAPFDVRLSVNVEAVTSQHAFYAAVAPGTKPNVVRAKDRLSYRTDALLQIDLTAVTEPSNVEFELECEYLFVAPTAVTPDGIPQRTQRLLCELSDLAAALSK